MEHLRKFLESYEAENKVEEVARLVAILDKACLDGLIPRRFMNTFYDHYFNGYGYESIGSLPATRVWNDIHKKEWAEARVQETFEAAGYIYMKFEKKILRAERKQRLKEVLPFWITISGVIMVGIGVICLNVFGGIYYGILAAVGLLLALFTGLIAGDL